MYQIQKKKTKFKSEISKIKGDFMMETEIRKLTYDVGEAAKVLGVSKSLLYREIQSGKCEIPYHRIGGRIVISIKALEKFIDE